MRIDYSIPDTLLAKIAIPFLYGARHIRQAVSSQVPQSIWERVTHFTIGAAEMVTLAPGYVDYMVHPIRTIYIQGATPYERGKSFGEELQSEIQDLYQIVLKKIEANSQEFAEKKQKLNLESAIPNEIKEEFQGLADGAKVSYEDVVNVHVFLDLYAGRAGYSVLASVSQEDDTHERRVINTNHFSSIESNNGMRPCQRALKLENVSIDYTLENAEKAAKEVCTSNTVQAIVFNPIQGSVSVAASTESAANTTWTTLQVFEPKKGNSKAELIRTLDWPWKILGAATIVAVYHTPGGKVEFANVTAPGYIGALSGMNASGLSLACSQSGSTSQSEAMPITILFREIIEKTHSIEEALGLIKQIKPASSMNLTISSPTAVAIVEFDPSRAPIGYAYVKIESLETDDPVELFTSLNWNRNDYNDLIDREKRMQQLDTQFENWKQSKTPLNKQFVDIKELIRQHAAKIEVAFSDSNKTEEQKKALQNQLDRLYLIETKFVQNQVLIEAEELLDKCNRAKIHIVDVRKQIDEHLCKIRERLQLDIYKNQKGELENLLGELEKQKILAGFEWEHADYAKFQIRQHNGFEEWVLEWPTTTKDDSFLSSANSFLAYLDDSCEEITNFLEKPCSEELRSTLENQYHLFNEQFNKLWCYKKIHFPYLDNKDQFPSRYLDKDNRSLVNRENLMREINTNFKEWKESKTPFRDFDSITKQIKENINILERTISNSNKTDEQKEVLQNQYRQLKQIENQLLQYQISIEATNVLDQCTYGKCHFISARSQIEKQISEIRDLLKLNTYKNIEGESIPLPQEQKDELDILLTELEKQKTLAGFEWESADYAAFQIRELWLSEFERWAPTWPTSPDTEFLCTAHSYECAIYESCNKIKDHLERPYSAELKDALKNQYLRFIEQFNKLWDYKKNHFLLLKVDPSEENQRLKIINLLN